MSFSGLFCSKSKYILFLQTKYVYCVYPAIQKVHNNKILLKRAETSIILLCFKGDLYHVRVETSIILLCFKSDLYHVRVETSIILLCFNGDLYHVRVETSIILLCFKGDLYHVRTETSIILLCFHGDLYHVGVYCYCFLSSLYIQVSKKLYQVHD